MTLWINGDWVTGEGEQRVKTNPVGKEVLWKGMTPAPRRWNKPAMPRAARSGVGKTAFRRAPGDC
jgi:hypothetical protein